MYQFKEDIYDKKQRELDKQLDDNEKKVETRVNLARKDGRKINEFYNRIAIKKWQDYV